MTRITARTLLLIAAAAAVASAQSIVSARAGAVHHVEGDALLDGEPVVMEFAKFPQMKEGSVLETKLGRAEILLTPGVVLRLAENSAIKMISNRLTDTRVEFLHGSALIEAVELLKDNSVTFTAGNAVIHFEREGLYRLDSDPLQLRVYKGKARVFKDDEVLVAKKGKVVELGTFLAATKFDPKQNDTLYRWSARRSSYMAMANLSAARYMDRWGVAWHESGWSWNPYFGLFTFVPAGGIYYSPFGYSFWSPSQVYLVYSPPRPVFGGGSGRGGVFSPHHGYVVVGSRGVSVSGTGASGGSGGGAAAVSTGGSRGGGGAVGRGGAGGGRGH